MDNREITIMMFVILQMVTYNILNVVNNKVSGKDTLVRFILVGVYGLIHLAFTVFAVGYMFK